MAQSDLDLAALVGSRICHDLISPIGAINNGLELMGMSGQRVDGPEMTLINESVANASARIRFFRIAFGAASDQHIGRPEVLSILSDMYVGSRLSVDWSPLDGQPRYLVRLALLAIQCLETAMPYGGRIEVSSSHKSWKIHGTTDKFNQIDALWAALKTPADTHDISPSQVQFALLPKAATEHDRDVQVSQSPGGVTIQF